MGRGRPSLPRAVADPFHRKTDFPVRINTQDFDFNDLVFRDIIADFFDKSRRNLGNVHHSRFSARELYKRTKICNTRHFAFQNGPYLKLHM